MSAQSCTKYCYNIASRTAYCTFQVSFASKANSTLVCRFLVDMPAGVVFLVFAILLRMTEGLGWAMCTTTIFSLLAQLFPTRVGTLTASLMKLGCQFCSLKDLVSCIQYIPGVDGGCYRSRILHWASTWWPTLHCESIMIYRVKFVVCLYTSIIHDYASIRLVGLGFHF